MSHKQLYKHLEVAVAKMLNQFHVWHINPFTAAIQQETG